MDTILKIMLGYSFITTMLYFIPLFTFFDSLLLAKEEFIDFMLPYMQQSLYVFNVPVLKNCFILLIGYFGYLLADYGFKYLFNKYLEASL